MGYLGRGIYHGFVVIMKAVRRGPIYGDITKKAAQILIFRARSWKKKRSWMKIKPDTWAMVLKKPFRMRAAMKDSKLVAPAHQAAVPVAMARK